MNDENPPANPASLLIFWIIWFAIFSGLLMIQFFAGGGIPSGENKGDAPLGGVALAGGAALVSMVIRFLVIPRIDSLVKLMPAMMIGLAFAEAVGFIGMFVVGKDFPETQLALFITSISALAAYMPVYANSLGQRQKMR